MDYLRLAIKELAKSNHAFAHHGVVVIRGGRVMATGYNHDWCHAEVQALEKLWPSERRGCKIISVRMTEAGKITLAKPCDNCVRYLQKHGIKKVWYTDTQSQWQVLKLKVDK